MDNPGKNNEAIMRRKHSILGIVSIMLSIPFYILVRLFFYTERLDKFYPQNFLFAFPAIFIVLPALVIGFAIASLKQKDRHKLFAFLATIVALPVFLISLYWSTITIAYIAILLVSK